MQMLKVDPEGFDDLDRRLLNLIIENFDGGPVGVESLAAALSEERGTLEDVIEPYLIQQGFLVRTARGRMASHKAYRHLGLRPRGDSGLGMGDWKGLFEADDPGDGGPGPPTPESRIPNPGPRSLGRHGSTGKIPTRVAWSTPRRTGRPRGRP